MKTKRVMPLVLVLCTSLLFLMSCKKPTYKSNNSSSGPTVTHADGNINHPMNTGTQKQMLKT
jgi:hypothetical protein